MSYTSPNHLLPPGALNPIGTADPSLGDSIITSTIELPQKNAKTAASLQRELKPNCFDGLSNYRAVVLESFMRDGQDAAAYNYSSEDTETGTPDALTSRVLCTRARIPEVHGWIPNPLHPAELENNDGQVNQTFLEMHEMSIDASGKYAGAAFDGAEALMPGTVIETEYLDPENMRLGTINHVLDVAQEAMSFGAIGAIRSFLGRGASGVPSRNPADLKRGSPYKDGNPTGIMLHYTVTFSAEDAIYVLSKRGLSYNIIIERDGKIIEAVPPPNRAWHGGGSINSTHIGVSFVNLGYESAYAGQRGHLPKSEWPLLEWKGQKLNWEPYPDAQISAGKTLIKKLLAEYPTIKEIIPHSDKSSTKSDTGPAFPLESFKALLGS